MNERIKELAKQAHEWAVLASKDGEHICTVGSDYFLALKQEKFAELIVKECANIVNSLEQHEGKGDCSTAEYIKEHFGV